MPCGLGYHRQSRAETKLHYVKLLGQHPNLLRNFDRRVAEFQIREAVLNGFTAPAIPVTKIAVQVCPGKVELRPSTDLCNRVRLGA